MGFRKTSLQNSLSLYTRNKITQRTAHLDIYIQNWIVDTNSIISIKRFIAWFIKAVKMVMITAEKKHENTIKYSINFHKRISKSI